MTIGKKAALKDRMCPGCWQERAAALFVRGFCPECRAEILAERRVRKAAYAREWRRKRKERRK
jgi:hypothetical protein